MDGGLLMGGGDGLLLGGDGGLLLGGEGEVGRWLFGAGVGGWLLGGGYDGVDGFGSGFFAGGDEKASW